MKRFWNWFERTFEIEDSVLPLTADAIIGVGIDVSCDGKSPSPYSAAVAETAKVLYMGGTAQVILFTGGYSFAGGKTEAELMSQVLAGKVNPEHVLTECAGARTYQNADFTLRIAKEHGWKTVVIVAQQWHARRVLATFRKRWHGNGIDVYIVKARSPYGGGSQKRLNSFFRFLLWDTLAYFISKLRGYC